jgi:protein SCO1/2
MLVISAVSLPALLKATETPDTVPQDAAVIEHLGKSISLDTSFTDSEGKAVSIRELILPGRPAVITPVYYSCPRLCGLVLRGLTNTLNDLNLALGDEYSVITVSFNHEEGPELAKERSDTYRSSLTNPEADARGWHFLTGAEQDISTLMNELGFSYTRDGEEFSHAAAFMVVSPDGTISRYFYGISHLADNLRFALLEAADGKIGNAFDRILLYCFRFDPSRGKYSLVIMNVVRVISLVIVVFLFGTLTWFRVSEIRRRRSSQPGTESP